MLARLKDGDKIVFLDNLRKDGTYGNNIEVVDQYWLSTKSGYTPECKITITEDEHLQLFPELKNIYWDSRKLGKDVEFNHSTRYYSYVLMNSEYKLIYFGKTIYDKIIEFGDTKNYIFNIKQEYKSGFPDYGLSHFDTNNIWSSIPDEVFLKTKTVYIEDIINNMKWTNDKKYNSIIHILKSYDINLDPIKSITLKQRNLKLQRILKDETE